MRDFQSPGRSSVFAANAMAATSHPIASLIAVETLRAGGNAVDAGVAAAAALPILEPHMTSLGGDCFALYAAPDGRVQALNASGGAPAGADIAAARATAGADGRARGAHAVTLPGAVAGLSALMSAHGRLGLDRVLAPAIDLAETGAPVAPRVAWDWARETPQLDAAARDFYLIDGAPPAAGDRFRAPGQAAVLRRIADQGASGFYEGPVAEDFVESLQAAGGAHTLDDFAAVGIEWTDPIATTYRGVDVLEPPPNTHGAVALLALDLLSRLPVDGHEPFGAARAHLEASSVRLAYDARDRYIGDPRGPLGEDWRTLRDPRVIAKLADQIAPDRAPSVDALSRALAEAHGAPHRDTVYLAVVDAEGGALSLITSLFSSFGSGIASRRYGVLLHDRGAGFSLQDDHPNSYAPGRRPLHTLLPGLLREDGQVRAAFGVMGGLYQAAGHARLISNLLDFELDPQAAVDGPRAFPEAGGLKLETGYDARVLESLNGLGWRSFRAPLPIGGAQLVSVDRARGVLIGASDPRKDGCALGF